MLQAMRGTTAAARLADDVVKIDEAITKPIIEFKNEVADTIKTVYKNAKEGVTETVMLIVEAIKYGKNKVVEWFNQAVDTVKGIADDVKEKIKAKIEELKNLAFDIATVSFDIIKSIVKIIGTIAFLHIAILVFVGKKIVDSFEELISFVKAEYENAKKAAKKAVIDAYKNGIKTLAKVLKSTGNAITTLGE
jgi:phage-related protein